jgi:hypothetical protein
MERVEVFPQRGPRWAIVTLALIILMLGAVLWSMVADGESLAGSLLIGIPIVLLLLLLARRPRLRVEGTRDRLVVRNWVRNRSLPRSEITGFEIATPSIASALRSSSARAPMVFVRLNDGTRLQLDATARKIPDGSLEPNFLKLQAWLTETVR